MLRWIWLAVCIGDMALGIWFLDSFLSRFQKIRVWHMLLYAAFAGSLRYLLLIRLTMPSLRLLVFLGSLILCGVLFEEAFRIKWPFMVLYALLRILPACLILNAAGLAQTEGSVGTGGPAGAFLMAVTLVLQALAVYYIRAFRERWRDLPDKRLFLRLLVVPVFSMAVLMLFLWRQFQKNQMDYEVGSFLLLFLTGMNLLYYSVFEKMEMIFSMRRKQQEYEAKNLSYREHYYRQLEMQQQEVRALRHDMKNQLIGILGELENEDAGRARAELERMLSHVQQTETIFYTGNPGVNAVLNFKAKEMERKHIIFDFQVDIPDQMRLDAKDMGLLAGSMLDNAIEACEKCIGRSYIHLKAQYRSHTVVLSCENSTNGPVADLKTRKKDTRSHGIGIQSMKQLVKEYEGSIDFTSYENSFRVEVTLYGV